ncbi:MAG: 5-dehydro-2-deoxygluconokinase [Thaumarchaeota archaeon]|nr:5-dehydro-2-deoxygluconokinase [Nitrososphaerota archaeon]
MAIGRAGLDLYSLDYGVPLEKVRHFAKYVGGTAANTVVGGARLGLKCALVTRVSDDEIGAFVLGFLSQEGVDVSHIRRDPRRKTGVVFAEVAPGRDGKFVFYRENAADLHVTRTDAPRTLLADAKVLLVTGTGLSAEPSMGTNLYAAAEAGKLGKTVAFNLDWRPSLWKSTPAVRIARYAKMLALSGIVIGNEGEYLAATGRKSLTDAMASIAGGRDKLLVVTHGENGSEVVAGGRKERAPGFRVPLLKGLGGGDGFIAGFLAGYIRGWGPLESAVFGNAVGAIVVTGHACSESMPKEVEVQRFLAKNGYSFDPRSGPSKR